MSSESSLVSTISPTGVTDIYNHLETLPSSKNAEENLYDFRGFGEDPLEWLIETEPSMLPESSLPIFPDLSSGDDGQGQYYLQANPPLNESLVGGTSSELEPSVVDDAVLNNIVDPAVTVQSLFLLPNTDDK